MMFCLERREREAAGLHPVFRWSTIYYCPERWSLELMLRHLDRQNYKITKRISRW